MPADVAPGQEFTKRNEGLRLEPYRCPSGRLTVGYGHNLEAHAITREQAEEWFAEDYARAETAAGDALGPSWFAIGEVRRAALTDMAFQMGGTRFRSFRSMLSYLRMADYEAAALECLDSLYARQTPERARKVSEMIRTGVWQ